MATFNARLLEALKELDKKSSFVQKVWKVNDEYTATLQEYGEFVNPLYKQVSKEPTIIEKVKKDGKSTFLKAHFVMDNGIETEYDLSYEKHGFRKGDYIDLDTLKFCVEEFNGEQHLFVTGDPI